MEKLKRMPRKLEKMIIEPGTISDLNDVLSLQKLAFQSEAELYNDFNIPPMTQSLEEIKDEFQTSTFLKASIDGEVIGSVRAYSEAGTCYIGRLIVRPEFRNQGIGTKLMSEIESLFKEAKRFELFTGHKSEQSLRFYKKLGYRVFRGEKISDDLEILFLEKVNEYLGLKY